MIAEILILTDRAEVLLRKVYRKEALNHSARDVFANNQKSISGGRTPPHFEVDGVHFYYIRRGNLYFLATTSGDLSTIAVTEFLSRLYHIAIDLCGVVTEESVRANFLPLFEMLCDVVDAGYVQTVSTSKLKPFIQSDTVTVGRPPSTQEEVASRIFGIDSRLTAASASHKPAVGSAVDQRELYVDVVENLTVVANSEGAINHLKVEGVMIVKNFLQGHPMLKIAVNEDLQICKPGDIRAFGKSAQFDRCTFHQDVDTKDFDTKRILKMSPPSGQFSAMTYVVDNSKFVLPVFIRISVAEIPNSRDVSVKIHVSLNIPANSLAVKINVSLPVPHSVSSISQQVEGPSESLQFSEKDRRVLWCIREMHCAEESIARLRLISHSSQPISRTDIGPASAEFEISRLTLSGLNVRYVKVFEGGHLCPAKRFVRYITVSDSYTVTTS